MESSWKLLEKSLMLKEIIKIFLIENLALILDNKFYLKGVQDIFRFFCFPREVSKYNSLGLLWYLKLSDLNVCRKIIKHLIGLWTIVLIWLLRNKNHRHRKYFTYSHENSFKHLVFIGRLLKFYRKHADRCCN